MLRAVMPIWLALCLTASAQDGILREIWRTAAPPILYASPNRIDLNGDGKPEVIFPSTMKRELRTLRADGSPLLRIPTYEEVVSVASIIDVDADGQGEIVFGTLGGDRSTLFCLRADGSLVWRAPLLSGVQWTTVVPLRVGDNGPRLCCGSQNGYLYCFSPDGLPLWILDTASDYAAGVEELNPLGIKAPEKKNEYPIQGPLAVGDVNSDGSPEVLFPTDPGTFFCVNAWGQILWKCRLGPETSTAPVLVDMNADGRPDVICAGGSGPVMALEGATGKLLWKYDVSGDMDSNLAVADIDADGKHEVVFMNTTTLLYCLNHDGTERWQAPAPGGAYAAPVLADLNGNGRMEIIAGLRSGKLMVFDSDGRLLQGISMAGPCYSSPMVCDLDGNGKLDVVVATRGGIMQRLEAAAERSGKIGWGAWRRDPEQTASLLTANDKPEVPEPLPQRLGGLYLMGRHFLEQGKPYSFSVLRQSEGEPESCTVELVRDGIRMASVECPFETIGVVGRACGELKCDGVSDGPALLRTEINGKTTERKITIVSPDKLKERIDGLRTVCDRPGAEDGKSPFRVAAQRSAEMLCGLAERCIKNEKPARAERVVNYAENLLREAETGMSPPLVALAEEHDKDRMVVHQDRRLVVLPAETETACAIPGEPFRVKLNFTLEGSTRLERNYVFSVHLIDRYGASRVSATVTPPKPTSKWSPGEKVSLDWAELNVPVQLPPAAVKPISNPPVYEGLHYLVLKARNPETNDWLRLAGSPQGEPPPFRGWTLLGAFDLTDSPVVIQKADSAGDQATVSVRRRGKALRPVTLRLTLLSQARNVLWSDVRPVGAAETEELDFSLPGFFGQATLRAEVYDGSVLEAWSEKAVAGPPSDLVEQLSAVKMNEISNREGTPAVPIKLVGKVSPGADVSATVLADGVVHARFNQVQVGANGAIDQTLMVEPYFGEFDVQVLVSEGERECVFARQMVATVVEVKNGSMIVNGEPFILKSVNVHGLHGGSRAITAQTMRLLKEHGFNNLRADWPSLWQVRLAGELGLTYMPLGPYSCTSTRKILGRYAATDRFYAVRRQTQDFIEMFKDEPSVLLWNSANEVGGEISEMLIEMYPLFKTLDSCQRPVVYANLAEQGEWAGMDIVGVNYYAGFRIEPGTAQPSIEYLIKDSLGHGKACIFTEFNHWYGPVHRPGADCIRLMGQFGIDKGMTGTTLYKSCDVQEHHPGLFTSNESNGNINRAMADALKTFHADVVMEWSEPGAVTITNRRPFTIQHAVLKESDADLSKATGWNVNVGNIPPHGSAKVPLLRRGVMKAVDLTLEYQSHYGLKTEYSVRLFRQ